jgi:hypothetical protein
LPLELLLNRIFDAHQQQRVASSVQRRGVSPHNIEKGAAHFAVAAQAEDEHGVPYTVHARQAIFQHARAGEEQAAIHLEHGHGVARQVRRRGRSSGNP